MEELHERSCASLELDAVAAVRRTLIPSKPGRGRGASAWTQAKTNRGRRLLVMEVTLAAIARSQTHGWLTLLVPPISPFP